MSKLVKIKDVLPLTFYGLSMIWSPIFGTTEAVVFPSLESFQTELLCSRIINLVAFALTMAAVAIAADRAQAVFANKLTAIVGAAIGSVGMILGGLCGMGVIPLWCLYLGAAARGLFNGIIVVLWIEVLVRQSDAIIGIAVTGALALYALWGLVVVFAVKALAPLGVVLLAVCPALSCAGCLYASRTALVNLPPGQGGAVTPKQIQVVLCAANLAFGFMLGILLHHFARFDSAANIGAFFTATLAMMAVFASPLGKRGLHSVYRMYMMALATALPLAIVSGILSGESAVAIASAVLAVLLLYTIVIFADTQARLRKPYWRVPGATQVFAALGIALASIVCSNVFPDGEVPALQLVISACACTVFIAALFLPSTQVITSPWGFSGLAPEESREAKILRRCSEIADAHSLTSREHEILQMLAAGITREGIAETFVISPATVKTHIRNIYSKLGIHSQAELVGLFEDA